MESGESGQMNFWPGFVDALSNMVMAMIFMMMVFMIMMFHYKLHQTAKPDKTPPGQSREEPGAEQRIKELEAQIRSLDAALALAQKKPMVPLAGSQSPASILEHPEKIDSVAPFAGRTTQSGPNPAAVEGQGALWTVNYSGRDVALDDGAKSKLQQLLSRLKADGSTPHLSLVAEASRTDGYSDSRRLAYYRAMGVRNLLLQSGWPSAAIDIEIADRVAPGASGRVLIRAIGGQPPADAAPVAHP